jgi:hypothetical protein
MKQTWVNTLGRTALGGLASILATPPPSCRLVFRVAQIFELLVIPIDARLLLSALRTLLAGALVIYPLY